MTKEVIVNQEQRLYVIPASHGYTCLGFDVAESRRRAALAWLGYPPSLAPEIGTLDHYKAYLEALQKAKEATCLNGEPKICPIRLDSRLAGLEGRRIEVTYADGCKERFWVARSTGLIPFHLAIATEHSVGGFAVSLPDDAKIKVIR